MSDDREATDRAILLKLVERIETDFGAGLYGARSSYWEGDQAQQEKVDRRAQSGKGHLAQALRIAKTALASNDADSIALALRYAPTYERTGKEMVGQHQRRTGGKKRAEQLSTKARDDWEHWVQLGKQMLADGTPRHHLVKEILNRMHKSGVFLGRDGSLPTPQAVRKHLFGKKGNLAS